MRPLDKGLILLFHFRFANIMFRGRFYVKTLRSLAAF